MDMLTIKGLRKSFGDKTVLDGLDLSVPEHSIFGFIGKNGAGKTTAMKIALGLLRADGGEVFINGEPVSYGDTKTNKYVGYLPDVPEFYPFMTASEYLRFSAEISESYTKATEDRIEELLTLVGLSGEKSKILGYSRGMKQRLGIASALLNKPKLLICDEPTSALDPVGRKEILDILVRAKEETTILFSTHVLSDVERICTDVALLNNGRADIQGKLSDIKASYRADSYSIRLEKKEDVSLIKGEFPKMRKAGFYQLVFSECDYESFEVLRFITDKRIPLLSLERAEPTLESLFMEALK